MARRQFPQGQVPWMSFQERQNVGRFEERSGTTGCIFYKDHSGFYVGRERREGWVEAGRLIGRLFQ